jgi:hypothetical protein
LLIEASNLVCEERTLLVQKAHELALAYEKLQRAEQALAEEKRLLERRVRERTAELCALSRRLRLSLPFRIQPANCYTVFMTTSSSSQSDRRPSWRRKLLFVVVGLLVLLVVAYFVITSSAFFKGVILPAASRALGGQVTVADASLSPFSQVRLRQLNVKTTGAEPLLQAEEVRLRYKLFSILGGTLKVDEVTILSPVVQLVENADGTSNLDPLLKKEAKPATQPPPSAPSKPPQIDLRNFALKNATVRSVKHLKDGGREVTELTGVNITLDQIKNGQPGKLTTTAAFKMTRPTNDLLEAKSTGTIEFTLGTDLMPQTLKAKVEQEIPRAEGSLRELAGLRTTLTGDITPGEVKELSQRFLRGETLLGEVKVTGPLDLSKKEGRLKMEVASIDRQVLNLLGAPFGLDFGTTTLNSTSEVSLSQGGSVIAASTRFNAARFSVTQKGQTTPPLDLQMACNLTVNTTSESAQVQTLTLEGTQNQQPLLRGNLAKPMNLAWGRNAAATGDSAFDLAVTNFNLAEWKPFLGDAVSAGLLSLQLKLGSERGGQQLKLDVTAQIAGLAAQLGATPLTQAALLLKLNGTLRDFQKVNSDYQLDLTRQAQPALTVSGSAGYDGAAFNLRTQIEAVMARLMGSGPTAPLKVGLNLDGAYTNQALDLRQLQLTLTPTSRAAKNELNATGQFDLSNPEITKGRLTVKADTLDLTQLYDAFAGDTNAPATAPTAPSTPAPGPAGNAEPEPVKLPVQITAEANLAQVFLHEISIQNWQATAKVDGGKITLDPCRLALNGAPVNASVDLNLGVKGYTYALSLLMDKVPLEPLANTFSPASRGQYQGLILANAQIKGAGVTDASMRKNLVGQAGFSFTNANIQLIGPKTKKVLVPIATLLRVEAITKSPLNWLQAQTELGSGNINLSRLAMQSEAFEATTQGVIPMAEVLTNSPLNLPIEFALRRSLAEKSNLLPPNTPPDAPYAVLPKFVTLKGTLGDPKSDLNELALGGLLLKSGLGVAEKFGVKVDGKTSNLLQGAASFLTGQKPAATNAPSTNQAVTEKLGVKADDKTSNLLQGVGSLLGGQKPATTNQPSTNPAPRLNPLDIFRKK